MLDLQTTEEDSFLGTNRVYIPYIGGFGAASAGILYAGIRKKRWGWSRGSVISPYGTFQRSVLSFDAFVSARTQIASTDIQTIPDRELLDMMTGIKI